MSKYIIILVFLSLSVFSYADTNGVKDEKTEYKEALEEYKQNNFALSYEKLSKLYLSNLSDAKLNFYLGRSAYETGHYEVALGAFERVEMLDSNNLRNRLEMARTYFMLKMYEDSENAFKEVLENPNIPENIRTNIELSLSKVSKVQQKSFTYAKIMLNVLYDSNVNYGSIGDYQYGGGTTPQIEEVADGGIEAYANLVNIYDIGNKGSFAIKNSFSFYTKDYFNEDAYDLQYFVYAPSLLYQGTNYLIDFNVGADLMRLNDARYLNTYFIAPSLEYRHTTTLKSIFGVKYQSKDFTQEARNDLDANRYELSYSMQKILSPRSYIQGNVNATFERKVRDGNIYVDFNEYKAYVVYANQFTSVFSVDAFAQLRNRKYADFSSGFGSTREDLGGLTNLNFTAKILPTLRANLRGSFEYVDSNQDRFSYKKYIISFGIVKVF